MWVLAGENLIYIDRITLYYNSCWDCDRGYFCGRIWIMWIVFLMMQLKAARCKAGFLVNLNAEK